MTLEKMDVTEQAVQRTMALAWEFENAAADAIRVAKCVQLHERLMVCVAAIEAADDVVRARWDALLAKGTD